MKRGKSSVMNNIKHLDFYQPMKHGHTKLMVCPRVRHKWDTDARWTPVRHVSDTRFYVSHLKNIIFWLGHASDTTEYGSDTRRTWLGHASDTIEHGSDTARTQPSTFFFQLFDGPKKNSKA